jgi:thioredoxin 1
MTHRTAAPLNGQLGRPHFGPMPSLEREIRDFDGDVLRRSHQRLVLVEFWAPWCTTCRRLHPALEHVAAHRLGRVQLVSVNIEMHAEAADEQHVHGLPLVKGYYKGVALGEIRGVVAESAIEDWVDSLFDAARETGLMPPLAPAPPAAKLP